MSFVNIVSAAAEDQDKRRWDEMLASNEMAFAVLVKERRDRRIRKLLYLGMAAGAVAGFLYGYFTL